MIVEAQVNIDGTREEIWKVVTDIENAAETISGIEKIEVLENPDDRLVGFKWRETRKMFGKTATEDMWITEVVENEFYKVRAESHGFIYNSTISIAEQNGGCSLTMTHDSKAETFVAKLFVPLLLVFKSTMKKAFMNDLTDIKGAVEVRETGNGKTRDPG